MFGLSDSFGLKQGKNICTQKICKVNCSRPKWGPIHLNFIYLHVCIISKTYMKHVNKNNFMHTQNRTHPKFKNSNQETYVILNSMQFLILLFCDFPLSDIALYILSQQWYYTVRGVAFLSDVESVGNFKSSGLQCITGHLEFGNFK